MRCSRPHDGRRSQRSRRLREIDADLHLNIRSSLAGADWSVHEYEKRSCFNSQRRSKLTLLARLDF